MIPEASTASLQATSTTHDLLTGLLGASKQLVTALEKADWLDRLLIFAALAFFALVVLFILKQRIVDRGLRIAFWWTRLLPSVDRGGPKEVTVEVTLQSVAVVTSSTIAATATALVSQVPHTAELDWDAPSTSTLEVDTFKDTFPTSADLASAGSEPSDLLATTSTAQMCEIPSLESIHDEL